MSHERIQSLILFVIGALFFLWIGISWERTSISSMIDFKTVYCAARAVIEHRDPYKPDELERIYITEAAGHAADRIEMHRAITRYIYLPSAFILTFPFGLLAWGPAHVIWMTVTAATFIFAAFLMWNIASCSAPMASGWLICIFLISSELLIEVGNAA